MHGHMNVKLTGIYLESAVCMSIYIIVSLCKVGAADYRSVTVIISEVVLMT
jgi:hypothetical protein